MSDTYARTMHVWCRRGLHCGAVRRRCLLPLRALSTPIRHDTFDDRPLPRGRVLSDGWRRQGARLGPRRRLDKGVLRRVRQPPHTISPDDLTLVAIRLGCLDQDPGIGPQAHQFVAYASPLEPVPDDGLPRFPERLGATDPL
jgi:hypothetical protein